jgi:DNA-binding CsgD family transcriptional regulator
MPVKETSPTALTRREREVAALVAEGLTNREIAERLYISERTADGHLEHIREKLAMSSRAQVAAWYVTRSQAAAAQPSAAAPAARGRLSRTSAVRAAILSIAILALVSALTVSRLLPAPEAGPVIRTVAGSAPVGGTTLNTGDGGPATSAQLSAANDVAVAATGTLFIATNASVRHVSTSGVIRTLAGGATSPFLDGGYGPELDIGGPTGIAVDGGGTVYFSNGRLVARIDPDLSVHVVVLRAGLSPVALCFGPDGTLYVADARGNRVWRRTTDGTLSVYAGNGGRGFDGDGGAAADALLSSPVRVATNAAGNLLYIADAGNNRIRRVDTGTGVISTVAGSSDTYGDSGDGGKAVNARLGLPMGVAVAANGDLYIADTDNNRVRRVSADGMIRTVVGGSGAGFSGDGGSALHAAIYGPLGIAVTPSGDLYIADSGNARVRMVPQVARP